MKKALKVFSCKHFAEISLMTALLLFGGFSENFSCAISVLVSTLLIVKIIKNGYFRFKLNTVSVAFLIIFAWYLITPLFAVDSGMAFLGFLKFMPVVLYLTLLMQDKDYPNKVRCCLPSVAVILGVISLALMYIPGSTFMVEGRLAGFFQYPNTFAMFLLIAELCAISKTKLRITDVVMAVLLVILILFTQSRFVLVIAIISNIIVLFFTKGKRVKIALSVIIVSVTVLIAVFYNVLIQNELFSRFFSLSVFESTFAGRLLYWIDSLQLILKNPFGLGYMGYYYMEQSIQTGVYAVKYIHNDVLQLMLDVGWVPCIGFLVAVAKPIFSKRFDICHKVILITFFLHIIFDFDLQFTAMMFILVSFLDTESGKEIVVSKKHVSVAVVVGFMGLLSLYFAVALSFEYFGNYKAADAMYSYNTQVKVQLLVQSKDIETQSKIADEIIKQNEYIQIAYSVKATQAFSNGDFGSLIQYKNYIFEIAPYSYEEYENYAYMLITGIDLYEGIGDMESANICKKELVSLDERLNSLNDRTSYLGKVIVDKPTTQFPQDIQYYIEKVRTELE